MSRIIVKDLPKNMTEDRLRGILSQKGEITDAKLMRSKEGRNRRFAFIGFRTEQEAQEAIKYFNKSFLDTSQISVEIAHKIGDENAPRPWSSRHSLKKDRKVNRNSEKTKSKKKPKADDPLLSEFLEVMQRGTSNIWSNDLSIAPTAQ